ncbi:outer membrane beta-barrel protein [Massilia sp. X63]|uniref:outer membrane beta-barrel protein n=1 Tax=Massilia sp. X63 TaxID=3237285 RepID=UPI0034DD4BF2
MFKKIAAATALVLASSAAFAAQPNTFYAGADVGKTKVDDFSKRDTSVGAFVGYNLSQNFAVEGGYRRLGDYDIGVMSYGGAIDNGSVKVDQAHLSLVGSMPIGESFSLYGRLGVNRLEAKLSSPAYDSKESTTKALYGVGLSYAFTPAVSARLEVQKPASDGTNVSAGVAFQF